MIKKAVFKCLKCGKTFENEISFGGLIKNKTSCPVCNEIVAERIFSGMTVNTDKEEETVSFAIEAMKWGKGKI